MKEVSCKVLGGLFRECKKTGRSIDFLAEGVPYPIDHLRNKHERIEWSVWLQILANGRRVWTADDDWVRFGQEFLHSPFLRAFTLPASLLFTAREFYGWLNTERKGAGNQMFTCVRPRERDLGPNLLEVELVINDGYTVASEFLLQSKGTMIEMPTVLGLPRSTVEMIATPRGAQFLVRYPSGGGGLKRVFRTVIMMFTAYRTARELKESNEVLQERYLQLEQAKSETDQARATLAVQARMLQTANTITNLVHGDLALEPTLTAVVSTLVAQAGFAGARIDISAHVEGQPIRGLTSFGDLGGEHVAKLLTSSQGTLGKLEVFPPPTADGELLLSSLVPTIAMAVDNAITHQFLTRYREVLESQVAERTIELAEANRDLLDSQHARDRIFANVNHEIRTPLSLMRIATAGLRAEAGDRLAPVQLRHVDTIDYGTRRLLSLIDAILLLAARSEGKLELRARECDIDAMLRLISTAWGAAAEREGVTLEYIGTSIRPILLDEEKVERAIANLLSNALKFTPCGGKIDLRLEANQDSVEIIVRDTGIGIDEDFRARAFGRFEQGKAPLRGSAGSGIGLSLVKEIVELHGGKAVLESPADGGTLVTLTLPRTDAVSGADVGKRERQLLLPEAFGLGETPAHVEIVSPASPSTATVLVAEDDPFLRAEIGRILGEQYRVILAPDGVRALELAKENLPDLLVSDVEMPGMNGIELLQAFQMLPNIRMPSALLVTAHGHLDQRVLGLKSGAVDYVVKPFDPAELKARVQSQIQLRGRALKAAKDQETASLGTLTSGLAHELRNAANGVVQSVDLLRSMFPPDLLEEDGAAAQLFEVADVSSKRLRQISLELLGVNPSGELVRSDIAWKALLSASRAVASPHFQDVELHVESLYEGPVWCAEQLMVGVISNLLINGAQAAGPGGWVRLANRVERDRLVFEVSDSGKGVPPRLREKVFQLYFTTKPAGVGTGIGLYMCRHVVTQHSGLIEIRDAAERAVFHVEVPIRKPS